MLSVEFVPSVFLKSVPHKPGVYRMMNSQDVVIYVGKAKDLKKRLSSYFRTNVDGAKTRALVSQINQVEFTVTNTETEALILENNLIKQFMPKYNVLLRDDKSFPYILITDHKHPRITSHRGPKKIAGQYFGPYPSAGAVWESLKLLQKIIPIRQCEDGFYRARTRPCLQYQLKLCSAPCVAKISDSAYAEQVRHAQLFLQGKNQLLIDDLVTSMEHASQQLDFEKAAEVRDQIIALRKVQEQQSVSGSHEEMDVIGFKVEHGIAAAHVLFVRNQKILGSKTYFPKVPANTELAEIFPAFLLQFYLNEISGQTIPRQVIVVEDGSDLRSIADAVSEAVGYKVSFDIAQRGEKARYLDLAQKNAETAVASKLSTAEHMRKRYQDLKSVLGLHEIKRMECFDISHTMGAQTMASCVVFNSEGPDKPEYRRFHVEGVTPGDDYAAMLFALNKRYGKLVDEERVPDIVLIDGGAGQLNQAIAFFDTWKLTKKPLLLGVAKGTSRKPGLETLLIDTPEHAINLPADNAALHLIQHIRDEAHRFAITGHRQQRGKKLLQSPLENIRGIGEKKRQALLQYLGGLQGVLKASVNELATVPGISKAQAELIYQACHKN